MAGSRGPGGKGKEKEIIAKCNVRDLKGGGKGEIRKGKGVKEKRIANCRFQNPKCKLKGDKNGGKDPREGSKENKNGFMKDPLTNLSVLVK